LNLEDLGWDAFFAEAFEPYAADNLIPARVSARHHGPCELFTERGPMGGLPAGKLSDEELPAVGDWVAVRPVDGERKATIAAVLPRRTSFSRKETLKRTVEQVVAANVDTVFVVTAFGFDLNPRRLERYLTSAWDSGSNPVIVVNKSDVATDPVAELMEVEPVAMGVPLHPVSAVTGEGLEALDPYLERGRTIALLGSSGVGKSTLVNRLAGRRLMRTADVRDDGRGRHTTRHRQLLVLPGGALLVDTPGLRELQVWEGDLSNAFSDISELSGRCRFNDCAHETEPDCAVREALETGVLDPDRWASYLKLQRELRALEARRNTHVNRELKRRWRARARETRRARRYGGKP
jgi:ribosome biogenesis GTPase / thiamine phosphate phosphatase